MPPPQNTISSTTGNTNNVATHTQQQLTKLVHWHDQLTELHALEKFMANAVCQLTEAGNSTDGALMAQGVQMVFQEFDNRLTTLKAAIYKECSELRAAY